MEEKILQLQKKIEANEKLAERLFTKETPEEVQAVLKDEGLEFSLEEINQLKEAIVKGQEKGAQGELSDDNLEEVAGGIRISFPGIIPGPIPGGPHITPGFPGKRW